MQRLGKIAGKIRSTKHGPVPTCSNEKVDQSKHCEYEIEGKGLFVIMKITDHNYVYKGDKFSKENSIDYERDVQSFKSIFKLEGSPKNLILGNEVTPDFDQKHAAERERHLMFTNFMKYVTDYDHKPSFVFFVLLSHGFDDGSFLLSAQQSCKCDDSDHSLSGDCVARNADRDIIKHIQECPKFKDIPKIFLMQCCRGKTLGVRKIGHKGGSEINSEHYIPNVSDSLVFHSSTDGYVSWGLDGSHFVQAFCKAAKNIRDKLAAFRKDGIQESLEKVCRKHGGYDLSCEKVLGGWIQDIFLQVSAEVSSHLITYKTSDGKTVTVNKQQPVFSCSLRKKLSFLKMIESQNPDNLIPKCTPKL